MTWNTVRSITLIVMASLLLPFFTPVEASAACKDHATFISDVTIADYSKLDPGKEFEKVWRLKNTGTCTWSTKYSMVFVKGDRLGGDKSVALRKSVEPGSSVDLKVTLTAPKSEGTYRGDWMLRNAKGTNFGLGPKADQTFWVLIVVGKGATSSGGMWRGEYFDSRLLRGEPKLVRNDAKIDFNWGRKSPDPELPIDRFSARWTAKPKFERGTYRFRLYADDGAKLWVDDRLVLDAWKQSEFVERTVEIALTKGSHKVKVEYTEKTGKARVYLRWEKVGSPVFSDWKGEYWSNAKLQGNPALVRNDKVIDFNWGTGSPATGIPSNKFSARWTREMSFETGTYRLQAVANEGIRVYLDGVLVLDAWTGKADEPQSIDVDLSGVHKLVVEYREETGAASAKFSWVLVTASP